MGLTFGNKVGLTKKVSSEARNQNDGTIAPEVLVYYNKEISRIWVLILLYNKENSRISTPNLKIDLSETYVVEKIGILNYIILNEKDWTGTEHYS